MTMNWNKTAERILEELDSVYITRADIDNTAYYMTHLSSPKMWERIIDFGEALVYHGRNAQSTNPNYQGEQLWLTFDQ